MQIALHTSFVAGRKEPLAEVLERIHTAIVATGFGEPAIRFTFADSGVPGRLSSVDRVLKRFPQLERFVRNLRPHPGGPETRVISNKQPSGAIGEAIDFATLLEIARGVPRSFPFHGIAVRFSIPALPERMPLPALRRMVVPGIEVTDSWWVNGRQRSILAMTIVEADPAAKKLPPLPEAVAAIFAACGKVKKTTPLPASAMQPAPTLASEGAPAERIRTLASEYRARLPEIVERARLPHDLPSNQEAIAATVEFAAGPKKPELERAFMPMGYDCRGETGAFTLRRRTPGNLTVELYLDVGTWSNDVTAIFLVQGLANGTAFKASLPLPVARRAVAGGQYPIGGPERWRQIVENLAALMAALDRDFVPAIEAVSGPSPAWYLSEHA